MNIVIIKIFIKLWPMKNEDGKNVSFLSNSMIQNKCKSEEVV